MSPDVEQEHQDIMVKALRSYQQHRLSDHTLSNRNKTNRSIDDSNTNALDNVSLGDENSNNQDQHFLGNRGQGSATEKYINAKLRNIQFLRDILGCAEEKNTHQNLKDLENKVSGVHESASDENSKRKKYHLMYDDDKPVHRKWQQETKENSLRGQKNHTKANQKKTNVNRHVHRSMSAMSNQDKDPMFKLAQCRVIYADEQEKKTKKVRPRSSSYADRLSRLAVGTSGVLVDSVGHVYGCNKPRPLSALPCKFSLYLKDDDNNNNNNNNNSSSNRHGVANIGRPSCPEDCHQNSATSSQQDLDSLEEICGNSSNTATPRRHSSTSNAKDLNIHSSSPSSKRPDNPRLSVLNLQLPVSPPDLTMNELTPRAVAFHRRNRTTHSWSDAPTMSQSMPNASFLHKQFTTSPPPMKMRGARGASPVRAGKPSKLDRPSSSYSYDGGFFLGAHSSPAEYFVIHPDWVSEALTINKIREGATAGASTSAKQEKMSKLKLPQRRWSERRCMSAPPSKFRNPIAWEESDAWSYGNKKDKA